MKHLLLILIIFSISCNAQTISLEQAVTYEQQTGTIPQSTTYIKDINNSLNKYIGTWKGYLNGNTYEFSFIKKENVGGYDVNWDLLVGRLKVLDSSGNVIYNTFNEQDDLKTKFKGDNFQSDLKAYKMYFVGNSVGCAEYGDVYLRIQPSTPSQMTIIMLPDNDIVVEGVCPTNFQPTIPYKQLIHLTKQ
ncbi:hypothetical protein GSF70_01595 [Flavobacteriaceae bacterium W22]|nr:hypothetical protein [Flavobacteriaceae bacterium W22]